MGVHSEGFQRAIADFVCFHCPLVASAEAKSPACGKERLCLQDQLRGRAHLARQCVSSWQSSLGAHLRMRKVTGRDASLPATLLGASVELSARKTVGALPQPPQGSSAPCPRKGDSPLTLFLRPSLSAFPQLYAFAAFFPYSQIGSCPNVGTTCVQKTSCANTTVAVLSHGWNAIRPSRFTSWSKTS